MNDRKKHLRKAIWILLLAYVNTGKLFSDEADFLAASSNEHFKAEDGYTMNFNNVSIIEYIRFVSKIFNVNFVFEEHELQFNVTIVSEDPVSAKNIMSALVQILRIHNLVVLEQENNLLITASKEVNQIPTIVSKDLPYSSGAGVPIVTRVFRIKNANISTLLNILRPMMSKAAIIEGSLETSQLIVTDITTNVEKVAQLLASLDAPHSPLDFESYTAKYVPLSQLIDLTQQIVGPFAESNSHIMVPQEDTNVIFIVSTPYLIDKTMAVLKDLDVPADLKETFYVYNIKHAQLQQIEKALRQTADNLKGSDLAENQDLIATIHSLKWIQETNSLVFRGDTRSLQKIKELLELFDVLPGTVSTAILPPTEFYVYTPKVRTGEEILQSFKEIGQNLTAAGYADPALLQTLSSIRWVPTTSSLIFTGNAKSLSEIKTLLLSIDSEEMRKRLETSFYLYKLHYIPGDEILKELNNMAKDFVISNLPNSHALSITIQNIRWIKESNSLLITGTTESIDRIKELIAQFDVESRQPSGANLPATEIFIYTPQVRSGPEIIRFFEDMSQNLQKTGGGYPALIQTLSTIRWIPETNSLIFTGNEKTLGEVRSLLSTVDSGDQGERTFYLYQLQFTQGDRVITELQKMGDELVAANVPNSTSLNLAIRTIQWIRETNSLLITGNSLAIEQLKQIIAQLDGGGGLGGKDLAGALRAKTFAIYTPLYQSGPDLVQTLREFQINLVQSGVHSPGLYDAILHLKWIERTNSLLISGDPEAIAAIQDLLHKFDVAGSGIGNTTIGSLENTNFLVYKLQYHKGEEITDSLRQIATDLASTGPTTNQALLAAVNSLQWISVTNSLIASGNQDTLTKLRTLIENLDVPLKQVFIEVLVIQTTLTNSQNFGLQWGGKAQYRDKFGLGGNNLPVTPAGGFPNAMPGLAAVNGTVTPDAALMIPPGSLSALPAVLRGATLPGFDLGVIGDIILHKGMSFLSLGSLVTALQSDADSTVVLNPKIITQDNNNSTIFVGQNIPFTSAVVQNQTSGTSGSLSTVNIEYRDVGVNLSITPILGSDNIITLQIMNDITQQTAQTLALGGGGINGQITGLQTTHTNMSTRVTLPDKHFLVLSGMIQDTNNHFKSSIPCLGGLPLVGAAFGTNNRSRVKNNIIIFVRPEIINTFADYNKITDHQENLYEESAFLPAVQESFEAGVDLVKTPENEYK
jgi:type II secretory pathway component GspD/PulD (secretin)